MVSFSTLIMGAVGLWTFAKAQDSADRLSLTTEVEATSTRDSIDSITQSVPVPSATGNGNACAQVATLVEESTSYSSPLVEAKLAYDCLTSVVIGRSDALDTLDTLIKTTQFQSNLANMKDPPEGYPNQPVDIMAGLKDIRNTVSGEALNGQYDFERQVGQLFNRGYDGHLSFVGPTYGGAVRWRRDPRIILVTASLDGKASKVYTYTDLRDSSNPPAITKINGADVFQLLAQEAENVAAHDADARWNAMFYRLAGQSFGYFISPEDYPGPTTTVTFDNGTESTYTNAAQILEAYRWLSVSSPESFYSTFVKGPPRSNSNSKRDLELKRKQPSIPRRLQEVRESLAEDVAEVPLQYPKPFSTGPGEVYLNSYFLNHPIDANLGVLSIQTFLTASDRDSVRYQSLISNFLAEAKSRGTKKVIIDIQSNPGGKVFLGYDAFLQFFPNIEPYGGTRMRAHDGLNILGSQLSTLGFSQNGIGYTSPFNYHSYISAKNDPFSSWQDMYGGPKGDEFAYSNTLRYNLTDPNLTSSSTYGDGIDLTGYGSRSSFTTPPFAPEDIILLSDGICGSTCFLFAEFLTLQAGVKVITIGGRATSTDPMAFVGATKGSSVVMADYLTVFSQYVLSEFGRTASNDEQKRWADRLPTDEYPIQILDSTVNFLDSIRAADGDTGAPPAQFTKEDSNCRLWWDREMLSNITAVWAAVADTAWGGADGGIDERKCIQGSFRKESVKDSPPKELPVPGGKASGENGGAGGGGGNGAKKGAAVGRAAVGRWGLAGRWMVATLVGVLAMF